MYITLAFLEVFEMFSGMVGLGVFEPPEKMCKAVKINRIPAIPKIPKTILTSILCH